MNCHIGNTLQPVTEFIVYPEFGDTEKLVVLPEVTCREPGEIVPPAPALAVTV